MDVERYSLVKPLLVWDDNLGQWLQAGALSVGGFLLAIGANTLIPWQGNKAIVGRVAGTLCGNAAMVLGLLKTREQHRLAGFHALRREGRLDALAGVVAQQAQPYLGGAVLEGQLMPGIPTFNAEALLEEATGIGLLGNSGSGKSCVAKYLAGSVGATQILVLDPHDDPEQSNWEGLTVIRSYPQILEQLELLLDLLEERDKTPLVIIADEYPAIRAYARKNKSTLADDFILRYGSEARKFNKLPIFCSQSGNTKALGLEGVGDFLENFMLIRLDKVAAKYAKNLSDQSIPVYLKATAYGLLIGDEPHIHPTHGHYPEKKKGLPPMNLKPLESLPLTISLSIEINVTTPPVAPEVVASLTSQENHVKALPHQEIEQNSPLPHDWMRVDPHQPLSPETREAIVQCIKAGMSQNKTIPTVFIVNSKGNGNPAYTKARKHFQSVKKSLASQDDSNKD